MSFSLLKTISPSLSINFFFFLHTSSSSPTLERTKAVSSLLSFFLVFKLILAKSLTLSSLILVSAMLTAQSMDLVTRLRASVSVVK